jgi:hypothetical protein
MLNNILKLQDQGLAIIPIIRATKKPPILWAKFQQKLPDKNQLTNWYNEFPNCNWAVLTGRLSNLTVLDFDVPKKPGDQDGRETLKTLKLPPTVTVKTGGGGWHYYYHYASNTRNGTRVLPGVDIRSEGGYVVLPPSVHQSGNLYEFTEPFNQDDVTDFPYQAFPIDLIAHQKNTNEKWEAIFKDGSPDGARNDTLLKVAGLLFHNFRREQWKIAKEIALLWAQHKCYPPLPLKEVQQTILNAANMRTAQLEKESKNNDWLLSSTKMENGKLVTNDEYFKSLTKKI